MIVANYPIWLPKCTYIIMSGLINAKHQFSKNVTGPAELDQVGTKYTT